MSPIDEELPDHYKLRVFGENKFNEYIYRQERTKEIFQDPIKRSILFQLHRGHQTKEQLRNAVKQEAFMMLKQKAEQTDRDFQEIITSEAFNFYNVYDDEMDFIKHTTYLTQNNLIYSFQNKQSQIFSITKQGLSLLIQQVSMYFSNEVWFFDLFSKKSSVKPYNFLTIKWISHLNHIKRDADPIDEFFYLFIRPLSIQSFIQFMFHYYRQIENIEKDVRDIKKEAQEKISNLNNTDLINLNHQTNEFVITKQGSKIAQSIALQFKSFMSKLTTFKLIEISQEQNAVQLTSFGFLVKNHIKDNLTRKKAMELEQISEFDLEKAYNDVYNVPPPIILYQEKKEIEQQDQIKKQIYKKTAKRIALGDRILIDIMEKGYSLLLMIIGFGIFIFGIFLVLSQQLEGFIYILITILLIYFFGYLRKKYDQIQWKKLDENLSEKKERLI